MIEKIMKYISGLILNPIFIVVYIIIGIIYAYYIYLTRDQGWEGNWQNLTWYQLLPFVFIWPIGVFIEIFCVRGWEVLK